MLSDVLNGEHWYWYRLMAGKLCQYFFGDCLPCKLLWTTFMQSVLDVPGLPTMKIGILLMMHTMDTNRFSVRAWFIDTPLSTSRLSTSCFCALVIMAAARPQPSV